MKKKKMNRKMRLLRPADGFLPLAFLLAAVLGKSTEAEKVFLSAFFPALFALASARGVRLAFSEQPSMRKVSGSVKLALALQFIGAFAFFVIDLIRNHGQFVLSNAILICAGMMLNIEHVFYEYLYATGDGNSATLLRAVTAAITAGGIMMTSPASGGGAMPYGMEWLLGGTTLSAVVAALIGRTVGGRLKGRFNKCILKCAPLSMVQSAIYPVAWMLCLMLLKRFMYSGITAIPFFVGLLIYELTRAPFRRAGNALKFNIAMLVIVLIGGLLIGTYYVPPAHDSVNIYLGKWSQEVLPTGIMMIVSSLCAFGMYGSIK